MTTTKLTGSLPTRIEVIEAQLQGLLTELQAEVTATAARAQAEWDDECPTAAAIWTDKLDRMLQTLRRLQ